MSDGPAVESGSSTTAGGTGTERPGLVGPGLERPGAERPGLARARHLLRLGRSRLEWLADQRGTANKRLTIVIAVVVGGVVLAGVQELRAVFPSGIDLEIPLRAATHWSTGAPVYPPSAMDVQFGPDLPYLYPPFLLPLLSPIAALPREPVIDVWLVLCLLTAVWTCRRLGIPWLAVPCLLAWPPFGEGLVVGNVQIMLFAAFVAVFYQPGDWAPEQRELRPRGDLLNGILAGLVGALKVTQALPVLYLARRRFRAAFLGVAVLGAVALATLPLTGLHIYGDWLSQLQRAADPAWTIGGVALGHRLGIPDTIPIVIGIVMALAIRGRDSVAWLGIALIVATPSVHGYTFLFLLPGLLTIRRDVAIPIGALFIGIYHGYAWWLAWLFVVYFLIASKKWPWLRAPSRSDSPDPAADPRAIAPDARAAGGAAASGAAAGGAAGAGT